VSWSGSGCLSRVMVEVKTAGVISVAMGSDTCASFMIFGLDGIETTLGSLRDQFPCALNIRYI
jgi:hypothetical protein